MRVLVRFSDPDNLGVLFESAGDLPGEILATIPGPPKRGGVEWVLRLDRALDCYDTDGRLHRGRHFLIHDPIVEKLDAEHGFVRGTPESVLGVGRAEGMVSLLPDASWPDRITDTTLYDDLPCISSIEVRAVVQREFPRLVTKEGPK